jgi:diacylglycerol kinase family enzyme
VECPGIAVVVSNFGRIQFDLVVSPGADPRDGMLDVAVLRSKTAIGLLPALTTAVLAPSGEHRGSADGIDVYRASRVEVETEPPLRMQADGDVLESSTPFAARVLPKATKLLLPVDSPLA